MTMSEHRRAERVVLLEDTSWGAEGPGAGLSAEELEKYVDDMTNFYLGGERE